jgi:hypothetical protein
MYQFKENLAKKALMASFFLLLSQTGWAGNHYVVMTGYSDGVITTGVDVEGDWTVTSNGDVQDLVFTEGDGLCFTLASDATLTLTSSRTFTGTLTSIEIPEFAKNDNLDIGVYANGNSLGRFRYSDASSRYLFSAYEQLISLNESTISLEFSTAKTSSGGDVDVLGLRSVTIKLNYEDTGLRFSEASSEYYIGSDTDPLPDDYYGYDEVKLMADVPLSQLVMSKGLSFEYSTQGVAEVQDDGKIKILAPGQTTITARYNEQGEAYVDTLAEYDLTVSIAMPHFTMPEDSIYFPGQAFGIDFSRAHSTLDGFETYYGYANKGSQQYTGTFEIPYLGHSEVDAYNKLGEASSYPTVAHYFVYEKPVFSLSPGYYLGEQQLTIASLPEGETLSWGEVLEPELYYYFDDDKDNAIAYTADDVIILNESAKVSAYIQLIYNNGLVLKSDTVSATYIINQLEETGLRYSPEMSEYEIGSGSDAVPEDCYAIDNVILEADVALEDLTDGLSFESSNPDVAIVETDGTVKIVGPGKTHIIAEYDGSNIYQATGASYELLVTLAQPVFTEPQDSIYFSDQEFTIEVSSTRSSLRGVETKYFYLDGSSEGELVYTAPFQLLKKGMNEIAADNFFQDDYASAETLATYIAFDRPVFSLKADTYQSEQELTITSLPSEVEGVMPQVYYYFDDDVAHAVAYEEGTVITISESVQLNAFIQLETEEGSIRSANVSADYVIEPVIEPLEDEKSVTFNNEDFIVKDEEGHTKEADLTNYSVNGILYTLNTSVDGEGYDGTGEEGAICMMTPLTDSQVAEVAGKVDDETYLPGSTDYATAFSGGITFMLAAGKGFIEVDTEVSEGYALHVKIGNSKPIAVGSTTRGITEIPYNTEDDEYVYIYLVEKASQARQYQGLDVVIAPRKIGRRETAHGKLYSVKCSASKEPTEEEVQITFGDTGKTTYCGTADLDFSDSGIKAFIATGYDKDEGIIWLTRVMDVPAGEPVLLKGTPKRSYNVPLSEGSSSYYKNMFKGNTSGGTISISETSEDGKYENYYMSKGQFVSVNGTANIGNNKCYLQLPADFAPALTGESIEVKIAASGKSSFAAPYDLDFTELGDELKAFTATGYDASTKTIWLTRVKKVQKGEGLLLKGTGGETYTIPSTGIQASYENMIVGNTSGETLEISETSEDGLLTNYYLTGGTYKSVTVSANIGNNKSYLQLPTEMLAGVRGKEVSDKHSEYGFAELETESMPLIFGNTTNLSPAFSEGGEGVWYTLSGQRISKPTKKGIYIFDGKKVIVK